MADTRFRITTPLFFILANFAFGDVTPDIIVQSNGNFTLQPNVQGPLEEILWKRNHHKVVEFYQKKVVEYGQFKGRTILDLTTGALTLTHLTEADSGEYDGELQIKGELVYHHQAVKVFDAVGKPAVTCQVNGSSVTLLCSGGDRPSTQYRWEGPAIEPQPGSQLKIEAAESSDAIYTCVLHNPAGDSRTDFPVKSCFPAPGSTSVIISVVIVLLLIFIIVGLLLFYFKKCYKKRQNEEDMEAQSGVKDQEMAKLIESGWSPDKTHDEHQKTALTEQHKGTDGSAGISQEESQTESLNQGEHSEESGVETEGGAAHKTPNECAGIPQESQKSKYREAAGSAVDDAADYGDWLGSESLNQGEDSEERGVETEGGNSKHPSSGTVPSSTPESPSAAPPKTENEEKTVDPPESSPSPPHPPNSPHHPAPAPVQSQDQEEKTGRAAAESTDETAANQTAGAQRQREKGEGQDGGSDGGGAQPSGAGGGGTENPTADLAQELPRSPEEEEDIQESQTESLNQAEDSEERGVETEEGNSKHPSSGTVPFSAPESPSAAPPKTGNEEKTFPTPPSSPSPPHPPKFPPLPAPALDQSQDQEEETEDEGSYHSAKSSPSLPRHPKSGSSDSTSEAEEEEEEEEGEEGFTG